MIKTERKNLGREAFFPGDFFPRTQRTNDF